MRIENAATEYIDGKIKIILLKNKDRLEDLEFNIVVPLILKVKLEAIQYELQDKNTKKTTTEILQDQMEIMKQVLEKSYPNQTKDWVENVQVKYGHELLLELFFVFGWRDRDAYDAMLEAKKKMILDLKTNPEKMMTQLQGTGNSSSKP